MKPLLQAAFKQGEHSRALGDVPPLSLCPLPALQLGLSHPLPQIAAFSSQGCSVGSGGNRGRTGLLCPSDTVTVMMMMILVKTAELFPVCP